MEHFAEPQDLDLALLPDRLPVIEGDMLVEHGFGTFGPTPAVFRVESVAVEDIEVAAGLFAEAYHLRIGLGGDFYPAGPGGEIEFFSDLWLHPKQMIVRWDPGPPEGRSVVDLLGRRPGKAEAPPTNPAPLPPFALPPPPTPPPPPSVSMTLLPLLAFTRPSGVPRRSGRLHTPLRRPAAPAPDRAPAPGSGRDRIRSRGLLDGHLHRLGLDDDHSLLLSDVHAGRNLLAWSSRYSTAQTGTAGHCRSHPGPPAGPIPAGPGAEQPG